MQETKIVNLTLEIPSMGICVETDISITYNIEPPARGKRDSLGVPIEPDEPPEVTILDLPAWLEQSGMSDQIVQQLEEALAEEHYGLT